MGGGKIPVEVGRCEEGILDARQQTDFGLEHFGEHLYVLYADHVIPASVAKRLEKLQRNFLWVLFRSLVLPCQFWGSV